MPPNDATSSVTTLDTSSRKRSNRKISSVITLGECSSNTEDDLSLVDVIVSKDDAIRDQSLAELCHTMSTSILLQELEELEAFCQTSQNLYEKVRGYFFLYAIHRFHLIGDDNDDNGNIVIPKEGTIPYRGYQLLLDRQFQSAIDVFGIEHQKRPSRSISSALAKAYYQLGFQTLADQVRDSVQHHPGNAWMFSLRDPNYHPYRIVPGLLEQKRDDAAVVLRERTPVRMDLSHCGWSDIFFLGMDYPQGARVLNVSINLAVKGRHDTPIPPIETYLEVIDEPVLKLTSIDLQASVTLTHVAEVFDFGKDYLGLLRAGIIASGIVPPGLEKSTAPLSHLFNTLVGKGKGLLLTTKVNDIPKGSRLAVSTNLLGSIISLGMRATGQISATVNGLVEDERRLVAARAILGEWLGGSGGGWQDSGGVWPGIKLIEGVIPQLGDPEYGLSRGCLLPVHRQLDETEAPAALMQALQESLVLVHGGMAQNVGPVLEMVTEKYLLREADEWKARQEALGILDEILECLKTNDIRRLAELTTHNFMEPIQTIIPWASNVFTETLIERTQERFGNDFWGFWMLGGCSGGGMGFIFKPEVKAQALISLQEIMLQTKREMETALPFSMDPVVYDFSINYLGTTASWCSASPLPSWSSLPLSNNNNTTGDTSSSSDDAARNTNIKNLDDVLAELGFDEAKHEKIRSDYRSGIIGLKQNRLPLDTNLTNILPEDIIMTEDSRILTPEVRVKGLAALEQGSVGVITLGAGCGSRWTQGAGCVKAIHPFCKLGGKHRSFLEIHLAKSQKVTNLTGTDIPHVITTSHMTDGPLKTYLERFDNHGYKGTVYRSQGKSIGVRLIPTIRDMQFAWEETQQQKLDGQAQKVKESAQSALMSWANSCGETTDYRDNLPLQCLHPVGHFYEVPNLLLSGTLQAMLKDRPQLKYLMLHNIDTIGADVNPDLLGLFIEQESTLSFEVIPREVQDVGGGLARVNGKARLVEGLALPNEEDEFTFTYYNSMTTWIDIDKLLSKFGLCREELGNANKVASKLNDFSQKVPTYAALKDVKKRWGHGQEDVLPTAQFEKLWSDMTSLDDLDCRYFVVPRRRGVQLKDQAQLDGWLRDGSSAYLETICSFEEI